MTILNLKRFCIEAIQFSGPERVPLACRILAEISYFELFFTQPLNGQQICILKHRLKVVLAKYGSTDPSKRHLPNFRQLDPDDAKVEINVHGYIRSENRPNENQPEIFTFNKEESGWYIDLPLYESWTDGSKADLAMVAGADTMLDKISGGKNSVQLYMSDKPFEGADMLELIQERDAQTGGGDYLLRTFENQDINHEMWLCDVTRFVFGKMPERIYVKRKPLVQH